MSTEPNREQALLEAAAQLDGQARTAFLDAVCREDVRLRGRLEELLAAQERPTAISGETDGANGFNLEADLPGGPGEAGQMIGRYKILEKVGEGGCGVVYVAEQTEPVRRRVAVKVIKLGMDTRAVVARFEAERQALAMMDHPNIARVLDAGATERGRPYFVMELVRGIRITDYCDQNKLSTKERLNLFIKVCQAIQHAHQKGIIHRDIKPSNILVTLHDGVAVPKVIDFGIAKAVEGRLTDATVYTQLHQFIGTPAYMSPEQAEMSGLDVDTRSDIYSLGVLLYELLTGKTPFDGNELMSQGIDEMRRTIRDQEPVRPSTKVATLAGEELTSTAKRRSLEGARLVHALRGDLDWIVMKCLEKDRTRRYETANGLAADLQRHLNNEPVVARPPGTLYRLQKAVRRNKLAVGAGAAVFLALAGGLAGATWSLLEATRERQAADEARLIAEQRFQSAMQFVTDVMENVAPEFQDLLGASKAKSALAQSSVRFVERLGDGREADEKLQSQLAGLYTYLADSVGGVFAANSGGDLARALTFAEKAREIIERLHLKDPGSVDRLLKLAGVQNQIGVILMELNRFDEGSIHLGRGAELANRVLQEQPENTVARARLTGAHFNLGSRLMKENRFREALEEHYLPFTKHLLQRVPDLNVEPSQAHMAFVAHAVIGEALLQLNEPAEAMPHFVTAKEWNRVLLSRAPNNARWLRDESYLAASGGRALLDSGKVSEAFEQFHHAITSAERQVAQDPANFVPGLILAYSVKSQAEAHARLAKDLKRPIAERADLWRRAIEGFVRCEGLLRKPGIAESPLAEEPRMEVDKSLVEARAALAALAGESLVP